MTYKGINLKRILYITIGSSINLYTDEIYTNSSPIGFPFTNNGTRILTGGTYTSSYNVTPVSNQNQIIDHVEVTIMGTNILSAYTELILTSPSGTNSIVIDRSGYNGSVDLTNGLDISGTQITDNAFWNETANGQWTLTAYNYNSTPEVITNWKLDIFKQNSLRPVTSSLEGVNSLMGQGLVFTPEFAQLAKAQPSRINIDPYARGTNAIYLIAMLDKSVINMDGGASIIDGVDVNIINTFNMLNADGSKGDLEVNLSRNANIEDFVYLGDGKSTVRGSVSSNLIIGGDGQATISIYCSIGRTQR